MQAAQKNPTILLLTGVMIGVAAYWFFFRQKKPSQANNRKSNTNKEIKLSLKVSDLQNESMQACEVQLEGGKKYKVLVVKGKDGRISVTSNKCTHYGAPLSSGTLCGDRVLCPWHAAAFNVRTGHVEDAPSLDGIHVFSSRVSGNDIFIQAPTQDQMLNHKVTHSACQQGTTAHRGEHYLLVGGGPTSLIAAETLRQEGFGGRITILGKEPHLPYDRVKLSKALDVDVQKIQLRDASFLERNDIQFASGSEGEVVSLDTKAKTVTVASGNVYTYDKLLLATGGDARSIRCEGHDLNNIFTLRVPEDGAGITKILPQAKKAVIIGSSFIGMEMAAILQRKLEQIVVVGMEKVPFERVLGEQIGQSMETLHRSKGIDFRMGRTLQKYVSNNGKDVSGVELDDGEILEADFVVVGAGIIPSTSFASDKVFEKARDGSIVCNEQLEANGVRDVFVGGDIARFPYWKTGQVIRIEHWNVAQQHGRVIARNMLGHQEPFRTIPFFWTVQFGGSLRYAGNAMSWDDIVIHGDVMDRKFAAYFCKGNEVHAVATFGADPVAVRSAELLRTNKMPPADFFRKGVSAGAKDYLLSHL